MQARPTAGIGGLAEYYISSEKVGVHLADYEPLDELLMSQPLGDGDLGVSQIGQYYQSGCRGGGAGTNGFVDDAFAEQFGGEDRCCCRYGRFSSRGGQKDAGNPCGESR